MRRPGRSLYPPTLEHQISSAIAAHRVLRMVAARELHTADGSFVAKVRRDLWRVKASNGALAA